MIRGWKTTGESSTNRDPLPIDFDALVLEELTAAQKRGRPIKAIADDGGLALKRLYRIHDGSARLALTETTGFMRGVASTRVLDALARSVGAMVFFLRSQDPRHADLHEAFADAVQDLAAIEREQRAALANDDVIDRAEAARVIARIDIAQGTLEAYKALVLAQVAGRAEC